MPIRFTIATFLLLSALAAAQAPNPKIVERYKQMLAANPVEGTALDRLWKLAVESGTTEALIHEFQERRDFAGRMVLGHLLRRAGREGDAARAFVEASAADAKNPLPVLALAKLESERGKHREAVTWLEKAVALLPASDPRLLETTLQLGAAWHAAGDAAKAAEAWERAVALDPQNLETRRKLANAYAEHFLPDAAIRHLEHLAEHVPPADRAAAWQQIAKLHSGTGRPGKALLAFEKAVSLLSPGNWQWGELLGQIVRLAQRQNAEAELEAKWKQAADANPRDLGAALRLVEFYDRTGNLEQQIAWLEKVCAQLPRSAELRLRLARALVQWDKLDRAAEEYDRLLSEQPQNLDFTIERARLDVQRDDLAGAAARVTQGVAARRGDEAARAKALQFFQENRLHDKVEEILREDARSGGEEGVTALVNFYFSQRRNADAQAALAGLIRPDAAPRERAAAHFRVAQMLKAQGELAAASDALEAVARLEPNDREMHLLRGELELALRRFDNARGAFARAFALSETEADRLAADAKLFETFRVEAAGETAQEDPANPVRVSMAARVEGFIRELMRAANERKDAASWLRVARWKAWNSDRASAVTFGVKAADLEPANIAPREFLAKLGTTHGDVAMALLYLRELAKLNPANRPVYLREIALLEQQRGDNRAALQIFSELAKTNPGNPDALADLAAAQERAGDLSAALATLRSVVAASPVSRKRDANTSLLRMLQRLGRQQEAAELMLREVDQSTDDEERSQRFDELLLHARQRELLPWLRREFEERRRKRADDYFVAMALGRILKLAGDKEGAFELFADAALSAPNQATALPGLVREAEDLQRIDVAVRLQEQLTRVAPQTSPDDLLKLAALYYRAGNLEGAEQAWVRLVSKFPRDAEVARRAAEFHEEWGELDRARLLLRKVVALDPSDARAALECAEAEYRAGRFAEAQAAYEAVLKLTRPVAHRLYPAAMRGSPWGERGVFAGVSRVARTSSQPVLLASPWRGVPQNGTLGVSAEVELRLLAISRLGAIAARSGDATQKRWVADWLPTLAAQPTDALWALYFGGAQARAIEEVLASIARDPQVEGHRQAFVWMALESGAWRELHRWINAPARNEKDLEWFHAAFGSWLAHYPGRVSPAMLDGLFPDGRSARIWMCALELAKQQRFTEAAILGRRVWDNISTQRAYAGREIARWHFSMDRHREAIAILRETAALPAESLESPPLLAFQDLFYALPPAERGKLLSERLAQASGNSLPEVMIRLLCHILAGDDAAARAELAKIVDQRPMGGPGADDSNAVARNWSFLFGAARQLTEWNRPDLALEMWRSVFADPALLAWWREQKVRERVEGGEGLNAEIWTVKRAAAGDEARAREQMETIEYLLGGTVERERLIAARQRGGAPALDLLARTLEDHGARAEAAALFQRAWELKPDEGSLLIRTLDAARMAGDSPRSEALRRRTLASKGAAGSELAVTNFALELADLLVQRGALTEAEELLRGLEKTPASDLRVLQKSAELLEWQGRRTEAEAKWLEASLRRGSAQGQNVVALRLEAVGKVKEALATRTGGGLTTDAQTPALLYKTGRLDEALAALEKLTAAQTVYASMLLSEHMGLRGEGRQAWSVLLATAARVQEPRAQLQLRAKLLTVPGVQPSKPTVARLQGKMRQLASDYEDLADGYYEFFSAYSSRLGIADEWSAELTRAWAQGTGPLAAGVALARHQSGAGNIEGARVTLEQVVARADADSVALGKVDALAAAAKLPAIRLRVAEINERRGWPVAQFAFERIRLIDTLGGREQAREALARLDWLCAHRGWPELIGKAWLSLGDPERARPYYQLALRQNALAESPSALAGMARVQIAAKRYPAARLLLRRAFALPVCREFEALLEYLAATGGLPQWKEKISEFQLSPAAAHEFALALFTRWEKSGQMAEAFGLIAEQPRLVVPARARGQAAADDAVTCERLRAWARRSGAFTETARVLDLLVAAGLEGAAAHRVALDADRAAAASEPVLPHLGKAAELHPGAWEHTRPLAEAQLAAGEKANARKALEQFLANAVSPGEREAALDLWERSKR